MRNETENIGGFRAPGISTPGISVSYLGRKVSGDAFPRMDDGSLSASYNAATAISRSQAP